MLELERRFLLCKSIPNWIVSVAVGLIFALPSRSVPDFAFGDASAAFVNPHSCSQC